MKQRLPVNFAALLLVAGVAVPIASAQKMNKLDKSWLEQEVGALTLKEEREVFENLGSDE